ncbi:MAG: type II secretion system F family protein [Myxococcales bacterium]|nr:type II secretion system F family protein [Myxococcales bacterium]
MSNFIQAVGPALLVALIVAALALAEGVYYAARFLGERKGDELKRRLRTVGEVSAGVQILRRRRMAANDWLNETLSGIPVLGKIEKLIEQADQDLTVAQVLGAMGGLFFAGLLVAAILQNWMAMPLLGPGFAMVPIILLANARTKRALTISEQLPDALEMMSRAIRAGHALPSSFKLIAQECPTPVAVEFARAYEQQNLGLSFETAVLNMCERVPSNLDLRLFAVSVMIQRETGGNLVEVLDNIARTMRERFKFFSKLRALTAEGRISGWILGSLPFGVAFAIMITNPGYLLELFKPGMGRGILITGITMWGIGILWIRSLMKVEY